ncbi:hypothetical protein D3C72_1150730 [compost metagenome]
MKIILQQPTADQGADDRTGAVLHHQQRVKTAAFMRAGKLNHQCGTRRIKQRTAEGGQGTGEPQYPGLVGHRHGGEACRAHQHAGDNHRFGAESVGYRAPEDPQALLDQLA